ncbi:MAG: calcium/proton exchanger [Planctomycetota bacterium]|nr:MAG: calcium/proton exchanger [Planctomycetota bacterium]
MIYAVHLIRWAVILFTVSLNQYQLGPSIEFLIALVGIFVVADRLKVAAEELSEKLGENIGGLALAFMGNMPEILISISALNKGMSDIVQASISGAIIGNLLLGLGCAIIAGGLKTSILKFNKRISRVHSSMVILACCGLLIPAVFHISSPVEVEHLSLQISLVLLALYIFGLIFTFYTHKHLSHSKNYGVESEAAVDQVWDSSREGEIMTTVVSKVPHEPATVHHQSSVGNCLLRLAIYSMMIGLISEVLTESLLPMSKQFGFSSLFTGVILLALGGNIGEYWNAMLFARNGKIDLAIESTMGSSVQMALLVSPLLVFYSYLMNEPLNLNFSIYEVAGIVIAASVTRTFTYDGESHWLEGTMMAGIYIILGLGFFHIAM